MPDFLALLAFFFAGAGLLLESDCAAGEAGVAGVAGAAVWAAAEAAQPLEAELGGRHAMQWQFSTATLSASTTTTSRHQGDQQAVPGH